ncbi:MAG: coniferyl aldehyde dehydrogenase [Pseudomonadota bacterium]
MTAKQARSTEFGSRFVLRRRSPPLPRRSRRTSLARTIGRQSPREDDMDQSVNSASVNAMQDVFHRAIALSREGAPATAKERLDRLARLRALVVENELAFDKAISADFGNRSSTETLIAETLFVLAEIKHATKHLNRWMAAKHVATELQYFPAKNRLLPQPLGVVGIIAPWNYPLQLTLAPAIAAIAAGNRVLIKPSELVPQFSALLKKLIAEKFDDAELYVTGIDGDISQKFASLPFDHLIFTGSTRVGRMVAEAAGRNLTPVTLELGGKSPTIVDRSADISEAAERIVYGKLMNAGQTCIAPDYVLIPKASMDEFVSKASANIAKMFGTSPDNKDYTSIVSDNHYARLEAVLADAAAQGAKITQAAKPSDPAWKSKRKFPPTIVSGVTPDMKIMQEEIFGPILPVSACETASEAISYINAHDRPLALYWFGKDDAARDEVLARTVSGGVTVNDCLFHFVQANQPMGGVGASGIGAYHGEWGFNTLSKMKPIFYRSPFNRLADLYPPYGGKIARLIKLLRFMS